MERQEGSLRESIMIMRGEKGDVRRESEEEDTDSSRRTGTRRWTGGRQGNPGDHGERSKSRRPVP